MCVTVFCLFVMGAKVHTFPLPFGPNLQKRAEVHSTFLVGFCLVLSTVHVNAVCVVDRDLGAAVLTTSFSLAL